MEQQQVQQEARSALSSRVIDIIFSALNLKHIDKASVTDATPLTQGGLNLDSIDILELIVNFEKTFGIKLNDSESYAQHFKDVGSVVDFVQQFQKHQ